MFKNKKTIISIVLILVVLVGAIFGYKTLKKPDAPNLLVAESDETLSGSEESVVEGNIFDLTKLQDNMKCTFSADTGQSQVSGVTYISGGSIRADYNMKIGEETIESHMVSDSEWLYAWSNVGSASSTNPPSMQGIKMKVEEQLAAAEDTNIEQGEMVSTFNNEYEYRCVKWNPDNSYFVLPNDVEFTDLSQALEQMQGQIEGMCESCELLPDESAKEECRQNFGC